MRIGYCFTGSYCTFARSYKMLCRLAEGGHDIVPIMSENAYYTDTRFQLAEEFSKKVETVCSRPIIHTIADAEPLGPRNPLDILIVSPCTGNTLAKVASGITDTAATMAIKAHLRMDRPLLLALASNDSLSQNLANIATLMQRKSVYFIPMLEDDPERKPHSLVAEFELMEKCIDMMQRGEQMRPVFLSEAKCAAQRVANTAQL